MAVVPIASTSFAADLLEREDPLAALEESFARARRGEGRLVFLSGDAGIGKSALVRRFCAGIAGTTQVLVGACDGLRTPRPLGPFADIGLSVGGSLGAAISAGEPAPAVFEALVRELRSAGSTVAVVEDAHLADEASLEILALLGRRVEQLGVLVLATYRSDELARTHPLRVVLGDLATVAGVVRVELEPLSPAAVATLAEPCGVDADELYAKTAGNPFFVTEVLASGRGEVPATVRDAVLARTARLGDAGRALLDAVAVVPRQTELWLLEALAGPAFEGLDECVGAGILVPEAKSVRFRHELARVAVEESVPPGRKTALHRAALAALADPPGAVPDLARLAHHAEAAGDAEAVLRHAPAAGDRSAALGAHREAAAQYARALRFGGTLSPEERGSLLERRSRACYVTDQNEAAVEAIREALVCRRASGDRLAEGDSLRWLSEILWCPGQTEESVRAGAEAVALLEELPPGRELAAAYANHADRFGAAGRHREARDWGARALALAERLGEPATAVHALIVVGASQPLAEGWATLLRALELARSAGLAQLTARVTLNLVGAGVAQRRYDLGLESYLEPAISYCADQGFERDRLYFLSFAARLALDQGRLSEAAEHAAAVLRVPRTSISPRIRALEVLGLVRARRGDPGRWEPLDEAWELAEPTGELPRLGSVAAARAEAAWLDGDPARVVGATDEPLRLAVELHWASLAAELAVWRRRAGVEEPAPARAGGPFALQLRGRRGEAEARWRRQRCPYDAALAVADADGEEPLRRAVDELAGLGAAATAARVERRLRDAGVRGPRASTRRNPAGLTTRQVEVLRLVAEGLRNGEIAERLVLSQRTVEHHVAAILRKLGARSRAEASAHAVRLGLAGPT